MSSMLFSLQGCAAQKEGPSTEAGTDDGAIGAPEASSARDATPTGQARDGAESSGPDAYAADATTTLDAPATGADAVLSDGSDAEMAEESSETGADAVLSDGSDAEMAEESSDATSYEAGDAAEASASMFYAAPHPPLPQVINANGGPVLTTPRVHLIFYPNNSEQGDIETFVQRLSASTYWSTTLTPYGVGELSYAGSTVLSGPAPATITSDEIESWIGTAIAQAAFGPPDPEAIYTVVYPSTTQIQQPNPISTLLAPLGSCTSFNGYHDNVSVVLADAGIQTTFAYAVIATCTPTVNDRTATMSHEFAEASSDPQTTETGMFSPFGGPNSAYFSVDPNHVVWEILAYGGEIADMCQPEGTAAFYTPTDIGYKVQRIWSNGLAAASHDPCAPYPTDITFFNSAPVLDESVSFTSTLTGPITSSGVTIPVGTSKTIEVDLFSDEPTTGPWTVSAVDLLSQDYASYGITPTLSFAWDRTQGSNGDILHLTITVTAASPVGGAHAFVIVSTLGSRSYQWPGLVVE